MRRKLLFPIGIILFCLGFFPAKPFVAAELEEIKERGKLVIAVKNNVRPLGYINEEGNLVGLEIDIARRLAAEILGDRNAVVLKPTSNQERIPKLLDDEVDLAIAHLSVTAPRARIVTFSPHYYLDGTGLVTNNQNLETASDLANQKIAVIEGSSAIAVIRYNLPTAELVGVDSYQAALKALERGQAAAFAGDRSILAGWVQEYPQYRILPEQLSGEPLSVVMPKGLQYTELRQQVNEAISRWRESGWLEERRQYWGLP